MADQGRNRPLALSVAIASGVFSLLGFVVGGTIHLLLWSVIKPFEYDAPPPLSSSWVIFLIIIELVIALAIGISCIVLSINMMRRLKRENDGDAFVRLLQSQRAEASFLYGDSPDGGINDVASASSAAAGLREELGQLQDNCQESPIDKISSPFRNVQRFLFMSQGGGK